MFVLSQIQNIKQTNSALKEKLDGGIELHRLPEVGPPRLPEARPACPQPPLSLPGSAGGSLLGWCEARPGKGWPGGRLWGRGAANGLLAVRSSRSATRAGPRRSSCSPCKVWLLPPRELLGEAGEIPAPTPRPGHGSHGSRLGGRSRRGSHFSHITTRWSPRPKAGVGVSVDFNRLRVRVKVGVFGPGT